MTNVTLKTTVAALALTAGTAFAGEDVKDDMTDTSAIPAIDAAEVNTSDDDTNATADMSADADDLDDVIPDGFSGMTVSEVVGLDVESVTGDDLGEIDYVIMKDGEYAAVVGAGGFLGLGEHDVIVPLADMTFSGDDEVTLANWTEEKLKAQPDVDESEITALEDEKVIELTS